MSECLEMPLKMIGQQFGVGRGMRLQQLGNRRRISAASGGKYTPAAFTVSNILAALQTAMWL